MARSLPVVLQETDQNHALAAQMFDSYMQSQKLLLRCRRVIDFQDPRLAPVPAAANLPPGFQVLAHRLHLLGKSFDISCPLGPGSRPRTKSATRRI